MPSGGNESSAAASGMKKGPWSPAEDAILVEYVRKHGEGNWNAVQKNSGLSRCGKSCRLRWANHLRPNLKKGVFAPEEELLILRLHAQLGNKWARMAAHLPGRTDNEIKNYWNTRMKRRQRAGLPMYPPEIQRQAALHQHRPSSATTPPPTPPANAAMHFSASPIPLLDPIGFPTAALLSLRHHPLASPPPDSHRIKRLRDESLGLQLSFSAPPHPNPPHHTLFQLQQPQTIQNNLASFDLDPVILPSFSVKTELPSTQLLPEPTGSGCGGLLDALLQEAESGGDLQRDGMLPEAPTGDQDMKWVQLGGGSNGGAPPHREIVESADKCDNSNHSAENKSAVGTKSAGEDMPVLLDTIPAAVMPAATALVPEWTNCENGGMSSGPSSVITADDIGLEMQHLASSLSVGLEGQDWNLGSCVWSNLPGIC